MPRSIIFTALPSLLAFCGGYGLIGTLVVPTVYTLAVFGGGGP